MKNLHLYSRIAGIVLLGAILPSWTLAGSFESARAISQEETLKSASRIDRIVAQRLEAQGLERNEALSDDLFARRVYLDVAGRVPTYEELMGFLDSKSESKRADLIDALLDSEGYVSHFYNYWADILRMKSRGRRMILVSYQDWIKDALRENKPYDAFVRELITSEGYVWDDGAVGYYMRDAGMPLDNMSNTAQVFLGTRMQCAQCHDHPFDKWTQKEYYHMAAYTFGVQAQLPYGRVPLSEDFQRIQRALIQRSVNAGVDRDTARNKYQQTTSERRAIRNMLEPMTAQAVETDRPLRLPDDYQYDNGRPKQKIDAKTPFGKQAIVKKNDDPREVYADWMTSVDNPRFSQVIANRLWKKVMGLGLIEPVDNLTDDTVASNPELMEHLSKLMGDYGFDMKQYLRVLMNTRTYQSVASAAAPEPEETYYFQGPLLRRMSAEQLWDSLLTLSVVDLDERLGVEPQLRRAREGEWEMKKRVERLENMDSATAYAIAKRLGQMEDRFVEYERDYRQKLQAATTEKDKAELRREYQQTRREKTQATEILIAKASGEDVTEMAQALGEMRKSKKPSAFVAMSDEDAEWYEAMRTDPRWRGVSPNMVRASEVVSPAPAGHFLRVFGQSDREIIESSSDEASITQALRLLNGETLYWLLKPNSPLTQTVRQVANPQRKMDVIFRSFFARSPTPGERELMGDVFQRGDKGQGYRQLLASLMNTQEFRFIQ